MEDLKIVHDKQLCFEVGEAQPKDALKLNISGGIGEMFIGQKKKEDNEEEQRLLAQLINSIEMLKAKEAKEAAQPYQTLLGGQFYQNGILTTSPTWYTYTTGAATATTATTGATITVSGSNSGGTL